jgi:predicted SnoaL-like aldol condensation-catalyzing enzyme
MENKSNKTIVLECYRKIIRDMDISLIDNYVHENYKQHSPTIKDGRAGLCEMLTFMKTLPKPAEKSPSPIVRVIADGDLVAVHLDVKFMGKRYAIVDLMRVEAGKLAEHWDAGQAIPLQDDKAITMTSGIAIIEDSVDANQGKKLVKEFYESLKEDLEKAAGYLTPNFLEYNIEAGLLSNAGSDIILHRIIAEGNFVVVQNERKVGDKHFANFDIFRLEDNKIAEHWSVGQEIPAVMAHGNGMF